MTTVEVFAPAKLNLALHVTGQRDDGYHLLDTLVAFASVGDLLKITAPGSGRLDISGPEGHALSADADNLILKQARHLDNLPLWDCHLHKALPVASGLGGGSADAAAFYRAAAFLLGGAGQARMGQADFISAQWRVGADVPMCIRSTPARVCGIGETIEDLASFPPLSVVLANPRTQVATAAVFSRLSDKDNAPLPDDAPLCDPADFVEWLALQRNDLEMSAMSAAPVIAEVLAALTAQSACRLARMSGSGATCFGLFFDDTDAEEAARDISLRHPRWWVTAARLDGHLRATPHIIRSTT